MQVENHGLCPGIHALAILAVAEDPAVELPGRHQRGRDMLEKGLLKIMSKMGISTLSSYHGAQIFEAIGLDEKTIERYFTGTSSQVGGCGLEDLARDILHWHGMVTTGDGSDQSVKR